MCCRGDPDAPHAGKSSCERGLLQRFVEADVNPIYKDDLAGLEAFYRRYRSPYDAPGEVLPAADADLDAIAERIVVAIPDAPRLRHSTLRVKHDALTREFDGKSELHLLHSVVIAVLRRDDPPVAAEVLFHRIWSEQTDRMCSELPTRWLISAATTFSTFGRNEAQRRAGLAISTLFAMLKLTESERLFAGLAPRLAHGPNPKIRHKLPMDLPPYRLLGGELDRLMLHDVFSAAKGDPPMERLAGELFDRINQSENTMFRRLAQLRQYEEQKQNMRRFNRKQRELKERKEKSIRDRLSDFLRRGGAGQDG